MSQLFCAVGTTSTVFTRERVPLHKAWLTTGMCCILFFKKIKKKKTRFQKTKKINNDLKKISEMFYNSFVLQCSY